MASASRRTSSTVNGTTRSRRPLGRLTLPAGEVRITPSSAADAKTERIRVIRLRCVDGDRGPAGLPRAVIQACTSLARTWTIGRSPSAVPSTCVRIRLSTRRVVRGPCGRVLIQRRAYWATVVGLVWSTYDPRNWSASTVVKCRSASTRRSNARVRSLPSSVQVACHRLPRPYRSLCTFWPRRVTVHRSSTCPTAQPFPLANRRTLPQENSRCNPYSYRGALDDDGGSCQAVENDG